MIVSGEPRRGDSSIWLALVPAWSQPPVAPSAQLPPASLLLLQPAAPTPPSAPQAGAPQLTMLAPPSDAIWPPSLLQLLPLQPPPLPSPPPSPRSSLPPDGLPAMSCGTPRSSLLTSPPPLLALLLLLPMHPRRPARGQADASAADRCLTGGLPILCSFCPASLHLCALRLHLSLRLRPVPWYPRRSFFDGNKSGWGHRVIDHVRDRPTVVHPSVQPPMFALRETATPSGHPLCPYSYTES